MDARKYASKYVRLDDVRDAPITTRIVAVLEDDRYSRLLLELETGSQFGLNNRNLNAVIAAWGADTDAWVGKELVLEIGTYKDWRADPPEEKEMVCLRCVSPEKQPQNGGAPVSKPLPPSRVAASDDLDDKIPF